MIEMIEDNLPIIIILLGGLLLWVGISHANKREEVFVNQTYNEGYEKGFKRGVECRGLMSAPSCELLLEKAYEL